MEQLEPDLSMAPPMSEEQVALHLQVSVSQLQKWRSLGEGPVFVRVGTSIRYRQEDLRRWIRALQPAISERRTREAAAIAQEVKNETGV